MRLALAALTLLASVGAAGAQGTGNSPKSWFGTVPVDAFNAFYGSAPAITPGTPFTPTRGLYANCTSSGQTTVTMQDGTTLPWSVTPGFQQQPFSATNVTAVTGCTFGGLN